MSDLSPVQALCVVLTAWLPELQLSARQKRPRYQTTFGGCLWPQEFQPAQRAGSCPALPCPALPCPAEWSSRAVGAQEGQRALCHRQPALTSWRDSLQADLGRGAVFSRRPGTCPTQVQPMEAATPWATACSSAQTRPQRLQEGPSRGVRQPCPVSSLEGIWPVLVGPPGTLRPHSKRGRGSLQPGPCFPRRTGPAKRRLWGGAALQKRLLTSVLICPCLASRPLTEYSSRE